MKAGQSVTEPTSGEQFDVVIAGGGTAGAALAGLIAEDKKVRVCLVEAGPDYGPHIEGNWPPELLNALSLPQQSHSWSYQGLAHPSHSEPIPFDRAKVLGGCSAHNGCIALLGHYRDYDHWVNIGNPGWAWGSVRPSFIRVVNRLRVRQPGADELTPFQALFLGGAVAAGIPQVADLNHPGETSGVAPAPVNISEGVRWNTALAYLDSVREQGNLTIIDNAVVDRIEFDGTRATGVVVRRNGREDVVSGKRVVLSAGAYGSPGILERSGVGDPDVLRPLGIDVWHPLPGVGNALADHPAVMLTYRGSNELNAEMDDVRMNGWCPDEQALAKTRSSLCDDAFDLHLYSVSYFDPEAEEWSYTVHVSSVFPRSAGSVHITSTDPEVSPDIDHGYLSDPDERDIAVLLDGVKLARNVMAPALTSGILAEETAPGSSLEDDDALRDYIERTVGIYYHPACSCRMGPKTDPTAVVDSLGRVHGLQNLWVCDASIFPLLMRANTNLPAVMVAEHLAPIIKAGR
jgi:choline dehydrogenase